MDLKFVVALEVANDMLVKGWRFIGRVFFLTLITFLFIGAEASAAIIRLDWSPASAPDLAGYNVRYGTNGVQYPQQILVPDPGAVSRSISSLTVGTTYYFVVQSYDSSGNLSSYSDPAICEALPWSSEAEPPDVPAIVGMDEPLFQFSWEVSDFSGVAGAGLEVSLVNQSFDNPNGTEWDPGHRCFHRTLGSPSGSASMNAADFQGPGLYEIRVTALDTHGTIICCWSDSAYLEVITGPPPPPDPDTSTVTAYPEAIPADDVSVSLITVTPRAATGALVGSGLSVALQTTAGTLLGEVQDNLDGTYTQSLQSSLDVTQAQVSAIAEGVLITQQAVVSFYDPSVTLDLIITGPGPGPENQPLVRVYAVLQDQPALMQEFTAYGAGGYGVNVCTGDITGDERMAIITGPGPGEEYGPHVRGFYMNGNPVPGVSFLAYGTNKYGVNVAAGDIDGDGYDEIISGAGPGEVFGPHVRGWNVDGGVATAMPEINFFAYMTHRWGVNVTAGDIDGDGYDEIITGAGPGAVFGPHVRGWNVDGGAYAAMPGVSFLAYGTNKYGVNVASGDIDGDGFDEIITGVGPGQGFGFGPNVKVFNYDGGSAVSSTVSFLAYGTPHFGVNVTCGDVDGDGIDEIVTGPGPGEMFSAHVRAFDYDGYGVQAIPEVNFMAYDEDVKFGARLAIGKGVN